MLSLFLRIQQAMPAVIFFMILGVMISKHEPWGDVGVIAAIGALFTGIPVGRWLYRRHLLRKEGDRIATLLGGDGRFGNDMYELRAQGLVAHLASPESPTGKNKSLVVAAIGASKNLALKVTHETALTSQEVGKGLAMDLELGDPVVDPLLAIEGATVEGVRGTLNDERVKWPLRTVADRESLHITVRDGLVRVRCVGHEANEELVRLAFGVVLASREHAREPLQEDPAWERLHAIQEARDERIQRLKAWGSQSLTAFLAIMCALKVTSAGSMKLSFGRLEIVGLVLGAVGLPRFTANLLGTICIAWIGFAIPGIVRYVALGHGRIQTGIHPAWSFVFAPVSLLCLVITYEAESAQAAVAQTSRAPSAKSAPKPATKPTAKAGSVASSATGAEPPPVTMDLIHDTEGRDFMVICASLNTSVTACSASRFDMTPRTADGRKFVVGRSRLLTICEAAASPGNCRPVTCKKATDCPHPARDTMPTTCVNGLCEAASVPLTPADVAALCTAGAGEATSGAELEARLEMGRTAACGEGTPCVAPAGCKQP